MHVLIDDQKVIEVTPLTLDCEEEGKRAALSFTDTHAILETWVALAPGRRNFRYGGDESDTEPSTIIIAEAHNNTLDLFDIDPHWDGSVTHNAYRWDDLEDTLPIKVVE